MPIRKSFFFRYGIVYIILTSCIPQPNSEDHPIPDLIISNVNIIDPLGRKIIPNQTILIKDENIVSIQPGNKEFSNFPDSIIIQGSGKFIINGFWNMHTHICWKDGLDETLFPILLSYGVTGVRDMGGDVTVMNKYKKRVDDDPSYGPILYGPGPLLDGDPPIDPDIGLGLTDKNIDIILDSLLDIEVDFLKVYSLLTKKQLEKISKFSIQNNIPFAGHVSEYMTATEASRLNQKSIEHLNRLEVLLEDSIAFKEFVDAALENRTWLCPTTIIYKTKLDIAEGKELYHPLYESIDKYVTQSWTSIQEKREGVTADPSKLAAIQARYLRQIALITKFNEQGIPMLLGSDFSGMAFIYPGRSLHEEMSLLSDLGIDRYDILKMATYNPVLYFDLSLTHGTIEKGKAADLVILEENPILDIRNTLKISHVIRAGRNISVR